MFSFSDLVSHVANTVTFGTRRVFVGGWVRRSLMIIVKGPDPVLPICSPFPLACDILPGEQVVIGNSFGWKR